jgi:peptide/nickel transport system permease protein
MHRYVINRILLMLPTLFGAAILVFVVLRLAPGDICEVKFLGTGMFVDPEAIEACQKNLGLDQPKIVQFFTFIGGYFTLDLGDSMWTAKPVAEEIGIRFKLSLQLAIMTTLFSVILAIPLGTISAVKQDTWIDYSVRIFSIAGIAMPSFWLGILIILGLLIATQAWFGVPWMPPIDYVSPFKDPFGNFAQLIWPAVATGYRFSAVATRMTRSALLEVLREDYVRTARAKGLMEQVIINRHALKNAMLPVVTIIGIEFAFLMGGLVVTEQVFNLNGLGKLFVEAVLNHDLILTQHMVMLVALVVVLVNLMVDILYARLNPRIRYA